MGYTGKGEMVAVLWSLMPDGQREMMVAGFFMIIDARWANGMMVVDLWSLMPDGQREMMVAGFFMIIDALRANLRQINVGFFFVYSP